MPMPGRDYESGNKYRFGFNGKENDNEVKGNSNQQDYGFRIYDTRLARFLSVDPLTKSYPELTPYQFASNNPIGNIDLDGLEGKDYKQLQTLTTKEKLLLGTNFTIKDQLQKNRALAEGKTAELFSGTPSENTGFHNDEADAFRHTYFNALNAQSFGKEFASELGKAHEALDDFSQFMDKKDERKMDLHNNSIGHDIGATNPKASPEKIAKFVGEQQESGNLVVFKDPKNNKSSLVPSNNQDKEINLRGGGNFMTPPAAALGSDNTTVTPRVIIIPEKVKRE